MQEDKRIAMLIDAENISRKYVRFVFTEIVKFGVPTYKRIYGDWTRPDLAPWKDVLLEYSITPMQQYSYTAGKNSTDSALIIDAMDILYSGNVDGFCIVSSDSDYTKLAMRLRESGMVVIGMGEAKTPEPFKRACGTFKYLESLIKEEVDSLQSEPSQTIVPGAMSLDELVGQIKIIAAEQSDDDGWASLSSVGSILNRRFPDFDSRNYGYPKLLSFVQSLSAFDVDIRKSGDSNTKFPFIRTKAPAPKEVVVQAADKQASAPRQPKQPSQRRKKQAKSRAK